MEGHLARATTAFGRMLTSVPILQPGEASRRSNLRNCIPRSAGNEVPQRRHSASAANQITSSPETVRHRGIMNASLDVDVGGLGRRPSPHVHDGVEYAFTLGAIGSQPVGPAEPIIYCRQIALVKVATALSAVALRVSRHERAATDVPHGRSSISIRCRRQSRTQCGSSRVGKARGCQVSALLCRAWNVRTSGPRPR